MTHAVPPAEERHDTPSRAPYDLARRAVLGVLRGVSQVFLQRNALSGALILLGLATFSWRLAALALFGSAVQSGAAALLGQVESAEDGLMGYNGALVGAAASLDLAPGTHAVLATALGAIACVPLHALFARLFAHPRLAPAHLPVLTAPFCVVAGTLFVLLRPLAPAPEALTTDTRAAQELGLGIFNGLAEVFLTDGVLAGACILVALFLASWRAGVWALLAVVGVALGGMIAGADAKALSGGLLGYSAVLAAIAIGDTFRAQRSLRWRLPAATVAVAATVMVRAVMVPGPVPVYTWPFVVVTWFTLAALGRLAP